MEFIVSNDEYITLTDETGREILMDEIYLLTNSRKLVDLLIDNIDEEFILFRTESNFDSHKRLILTHKEFKKQSKYWNIKTQKHYKCVGLDPITGDAMLRQINGNKRKLKYSRNTKDWAILR